MQIIRVISNERFICVLIGSSGEESDSSREIPSNLDISRALQVIPLSPNSDFYCSRDNSDKRVSTQDYLLLMEY